MNRYRKQIAEILKIAGVKINGRNSWDLKINNEEFYKRVLSSPSIGLGESYMDGCFECKRLDEFFYRILSADLDKKIKLDFDKINLFIKSKLTNMQNKWRASKVAKVHYDLGNELYSSFLDPYYQYSCGYFKNTSDLVEAQRQKLDLICRKLLLSRGDKLLDIGCGWGGLAKYAAEHYGCDVIGVNISNEQIKFARKFTKGLPIKILKLDYRDIKGKFNKVVSVGMFEHVGYKNYNKFFTTVQKCMTNDGLFLLHTIGNSDSVTAGDPWLDKYIFPNSMLPSLKQISEASENLFILEDVHNFGIYYYPTLMSWYKNFKNNWNKIQHKFDDRFYRMWEYYLLSCAGAFKARQMQLYQIVFSKKEHRGYKSIR